jgi:hypothetical protein
VVVQWKLIVPDASDVVDGKNGAGCGLLGNLVMMMMEK